MKFIHAADIHLDSPLVGLERYDGAPVEELRGATRKAFENLIRLAIDEAVDFVLLVGDIYDGNWRDYNTGLYFIRQMGELNRHGIRVFLVSGNHDAANRMSRELKLPDNVRRFSDKKPETVIDENLSVAIHGQSYRTAELKDNLAAGFPGSVPGCFNIGLLHTGVTGRPGHANYAPCSLGNLTAHNYDYWALGHIHQREDMHRDPWVIMPGNIQGRHIRETGDKGCTLITVEDGEVKAVEHRSLDVVRWTLLDVVVDQATTVDEALDLAVSACEEMLAGCGERLLAVRIVFTGTTVLHGRLLGEEERWQEVLRGLLLGQFGERLWAEKILFKTAGFAHGEADGNDSLALLLDAVGQDHDLAELMAAERGEIDTVLNKIPVELREQLELPDLDNPDDLNELFTEVREMLPTLLAIKRGSQ